MGIQDQKTRPNTRPTNLVFTNRSSSLLGISSFFWGLLLLSLLFSCTPSGTQMDFQKLPESGWPLRTPVRFELSVSDTLQPQSIWLRLRHTNEYPFSNIYLITSLQHPNGEVITDTLSYDLAAPDGRWLGSGNGLISQELPFKKKVRFETSKPYVLSVYHRVRQLGEAEGMAILPGVKSVGYRLAPAP